MTTDEAIIGLEDLFVSWREQIEGSHRRPHRVSTGEIVALERWMESITFLIAEARKYEFLVGTLTEAGGRPLEFVELHAVEIGPK